MDHTRLGRKLGGRVLIAIVFFACAADISWAGTSLPDALRGVRIRDAYFQSDFKEVGRVSRIAGDGDVVVLRRARGEAFKAKVEDPVHENDAVFTIGAIRCRIVFCDKNIVTMAPDSDLLVEEVAVEPSRGEKRSFFEVTRGRAVFYALKLFSIRDIRMKVKTPTATVGIRGTKFGTEVEFLDLRGRNLPGRMVASTNPVISAAEPARETLARVYVSEGLVEVTSEADEKTGSVGPGELIEAGPLGLGPVSFDPGRVDSFMDSVEGPFVRRFQGPVTVESGDVMGDKSMQEHEDTFKQVEQIQDARQVETQKDVDHFHEESTSPPPEEHSHHHEMESGME